MKSIYTIVGMKHRGTEKLVASMNVGEPLILIREPTNQHDPNAVQVWGRHTHLGYVKGTEAVALAFAMDATLVQSKLAIFAIGDRWPAAEVEESAP